jgi:2-polyprenyl-6-hydroxyphenyl methylase/3-demethylubiquinone-9 3-methyltransferase
VAGGILSAGRDAFSGRLPVRYQGVTLDKRFLELLREDLRPGMAVLDVGAGRKPTMRAEDRPQDVRWVGLDLSMAELQAAPPGSYDEEVEEDVTRFRPELEGRFDLVISFQVLEHVKPLDTAIANMRRYLKPGGVLIVQMSGALCLQAVVNRVIPSSLSKKLLRRLTPNRPVSTIFPAYYHHCWSRPLRRIFSTWSEARIEPLFVGAAYLKRSRIATAAWVSYEEWTVTRGHDALASYYLVRAVA